MDNTLIEKNARVKTGDQAGFTLIEAVIVIILIGIIASITSAFIIRPVQDYTDITQRAQLVDAAEMALRRMARDIRQALPNSVRIAGGGTVLEMLNTVDAARYRDEAPPSTATAVLDFVLPDTDFDVIGSLQNFAAINTATDDVVIYNLTATGANNNAYVGDNRAQLGGATTATHINLAAATLFPLASPTQRFYIIDEPVVYLCDTGANTLRRYDGHNIVANQFTVDTDAELLAQGASSALMTEFVSACAFSYQPGTPQRAGLVTLRLTLRDGGEMITLLHQIHVQNSP